MTIDKGIFIRNIYYMLTYAFQELKQNNYEEIAGEEFDEIHDLFAEILLRGISFQLKQGLHKEYISCHGSLSTLKGKLDICGTVNNLMRKQQKIDCEYDELSENNYGAQNETYIEGWEKKTSNLLIYKRLCKI